jgi:hypothetical protein
MQNSKIDLTTVEKLDHRDETITYISVNPKGKKTNDDSLLVFLSIMTIYRQSIIVYVR